MKKAVYFAALLTLTMLVLACRTKDKSENMSRGTKFYMGTYTNNESEGIYAYSLLENGRIDSIGLVAKTENPSFLTRSTDSNFLLAVNENEEGTVSSFKIDSNRLEFINKSSSGGAHPCFVTVNQDGDVLVANYSSGTIGYLQHQSNGSLSPLLDVQRHTSQGSHPRQDGPHAHSVWFDPEGKTIISVDLGTNDLYFSTIDRSRKKLIPFSKPTLKLAPGAGPRHLAFHPEQPWIYVINELNSTVSLVKNIKGSYKLQSSISTLPESFSGESFCADIHISDDGRFLYASNRGHNSIAIFAVAIDGTLELIGHESTLGEWPRNFALSPDNSFLLVANQHTDNIVSFKRNAENGTLEFVAEVEAYTPVCILF